MIHKIQHGMEVLFMVLVIQWQPVFGIIAARYIAIKNALSAKFNIAYWIGIIDGQASSEYDRKRTLGKNKILD